MKGYVCDKCKKELQYEQVAGGLRVKRENKAGELVYNAYCPKCKNYYEMKY